MSAAEKEIASRWGWSLLPWAVLAIIFGAVPLLPPTDCYDTEPPTALGTTPYVACCIVAGLLLVGGAGYRIWRLMEAQRSFTTGDRNLFAGAVVVAAIAGLPILFSPRGNNIATLAVGFVVAVGTYVVMVGGFLAGHTSEELGLLVPIALLLVGGLICAPLVALILGLQGGGLC